MAKRRPSTRARASFRRAVSYTCCTVDRATPIYFLSGDRDPVGSMGAGVKKVAGMFRAAGCGDVTLKLYPGGRHEMFNEINRQEVMDDLLAWLQSRGL